MPVPPLIGERPDLGRRSAIGRQVGAVAPPPRQGVSGPIDQVPDWGSTRESVPAAYDEASCAGATTDRVREFNVEARAFLLVRCDGLPR